MEGYHRKRRSGPVVRSQVRQRPAAAAPKLVQHPAVGDLEEPRTERAAARIVGAGFAPERKEDILLDILRRGGIEALGGDVEDEGRIAGIQGRKRIGFPGGESKRQLLVRPRVLRRALGLGHRTTSFHISEYTAAGQLDSPLSLMPRK